MEVVKYPDYQKWEALAKRPLIDNGALDEKVKSVLNDIKTDGDKALIEYTEKFDRVKLSHLQLSEEDMEAAEASVSVELKEAIKLAAENITSFHQAQVPGELELETVKGVVCRQKPVAIPKVGLYIPGGTAPLFSTVLMLGIPASIAGCSEIVLCTPPDKNGNINPVILYAAKLVGVTKIFKLGGVQAIGAMAYGSETVPKADKIFGPGNQYVMAAKQLVSRDAVAIDMPAGPSEVAVIADSSARPEFIAYDLLSQAEHGTDSQVMLLTCDEGIVPDMQKALYAALDKLPRKDFAAKAIDNSRIIVFKNNDDLMAFCNLYAPEHLIIATDNAREISEAVINAGSVFVGHYTPESAGDYASGTNHTLPTNGWANAYSGVNIDSFQKKITFQEISREGILNLGPAIELMAESEQLEAHRLAVTVRLNEITGSDDE